MVHEEIKEFFTRSHDPIGFELRGIGAQGFFNEVYENNDEIVTMSQPSGGFLIKTKRYNYIVLVDDPNREQNNELKAKLRGAEAVCEQIQIEINKLKKSNEDLKEALSVNAAQFKHDKEYLNLCLTRERKDVEKKEKIIAKQDTFIAEFRNKND